MNDGKIGKILNQRIGFGAQTNQALRGLETKITKASERKTDLENDINKFTSERDGYVRQITSDQEKIEAFRKEDEALIVEYEGLRITNVTIEVSIKETSERLLGVMRVPSNISLDLHEKLVNLSSYMNRLKLPKTQSMEFFEELSHADLCVCGRPIGEEERKRIIENSQNYLTSDNIGEINAIKTSIRTLPEREDISQLIKDIKDLIVKKNLNEKRLSKLDRETKNKVKIKELDDNIKKLERLRDELNDILITLTETRKEEQDLLSLTWEDNLDLCKKYIENLEIQLATATNAVEFRTKSIVLRNILTEIHEQSLKRLKNNILFKTNEKIEKILKTKNIRISEIGSCLALSDRDGVSEGQKLSIAYAFLSTLFSESPHKLPFVVDTPAAPLDLEVRREVAEILPNLFDQTVVFITSGEKAGFAERLYTRNDCLFLTVTRTPEGAVVKDGIEIFKNFQSEES
jgi:DNA repair exonuclease SbcCD ATPase subunit